jgi:hypothetical protein
VKKPVVNQITIVEIMPSRKEKNLVPRAFYANANEKEPVRVSVSHPLPLQQGGAR